MNEELEWECYLCARDFPGTFIAGGWIGNYHPLCDGCADSVYFDKTSKFYPAMTFHYSVGDIPRISTEN